MLGAFLLYTSKLRIWGSQPLHQIQFRHRGTSSVCQSALGISSTYERLLVDVMPQGERERCCCILMNAYLVPDAPGKGGPLFHM